MTKRDKVLQYLKTHRSITPLQAFNLCKCLCLSSCIRDLRARGIPIRSRMNYQGGTQFARHYLVRKCATTTSS